MVITGQATVIAHIGWPTNSFKAPMIYNPWLAAKGIDAVVVPLGVEASDFPELLRPLFTIRNMRGALITMPHKVTTAGLVDELSVTAQVAGACNAILRRPDGLLLGDMFDGIGFVRAMQSKGRKISGGRALIVGCGGVGSAIAASLAEAGIADLGLFDARASIADALARRLRQHYPIVRTATGSCDPDGHDIVVNATPLGMQPGDKLPVDVTRIAPGTYVGEVVMIPTMTPLLQAAQKIGCPIQVGTDMLFEMIPFYLKFFSFGDTTASELRAIARLGD